MDTKTPPPSVAGQQIQQSIGQPTIFRSSNSKNSSISLPKGSFKIILSSFVMLFLVGGVGVGVYLVGQNQQLKSKASNDVPANLSKIVSQDIVNPATRSAQASSSASPVASTSGISNQSTTPSTSSASLAKFDFNSDGKANSVDLSVMYGGWGTPKTELQSKADLNGDGLINGIDYSQFVQHFNK